MPSKNVIKPYLAGGYYHIYNRGVNKRTIFKDEQDYAVFLSYLKIYLLPKDKEGLSSIISNKNSSPKEKDQALRELNLNNFNGQIELIAYCLMPNHFHLLVHQINERDIKLFLQSLMTRYTMFFNKKYRRIGSLFQGCYKAVLVETDEQLLYLTRYIHLNPVKSSHERSHLLKQPSSYRNYLGEIKQDWVKPSFILQNFSKEGFNSYQNFVETDDFETEDVSVHLLENLLLD